jgi:hypothetical protein
MNVENAANILAGSILTGLAFVAMVITAVVINNIIAKYWKPVKLFTPDSWKAFNPPTERIDPPAEKNIFSPHINKGVDTETK